jgi:crotonobetainyl-CoA:carnitine CoA-transferase CaiB-like acyl-CoA transferase
LGRLQRAQSVFPLHQPNKKGITLDYKQPEGRALFLRLVDSVDVLVEDYRTTVTDEPDRPPTSVGLPDLRSRHRHVGGTGHPRGPIRAPAHRPRPPVECSLLETAIGFSSWTSAQWLADHEAPNRQGSRRRQNAPYQRMRTKNGYLMIGAAGEAIWQRCAEALGHPEWCQDPRFATDRQRMENRAALESVMEAVLVTKTTDHWVEVLQAAGVPYGPVHNYAQMFADPQVHHRGMVQYASDPELGEVPHLRTPVKIGEGVCVRSVAPKLGEHNAEIFGWLGVSEAEMKELRARWIL